LKNLRASEGAKHGAAVSSAEPADLPTLFM
jgi:hypothetical protein